MQNETSIEKILTPNDLGKTGSHQMGIAVSKKLLPFFPPLDETKKNPDCHITIVDKKDGETFLWRFIHYNNKLHSVHGTRDEYRLTGTGISHFLNKYIDVQPGHVLLLEFDGALQILASISAPEEMQ